MVPLDQLDVAHVEIRSAAMTEVASSFQEATGTHRLVHDEVSAHVDKPDVFVEAVLVGEVEVRTIPNDPEKRIYMPLRGGAARLYLQGKLIEGQWHLQQGVGVEFFAERYGAINLIPFKTWIVLTPHF